MDMHVAIVGAGIGGLALAIALHNKGIPFTLYEEAKEYSAVGAGIGFGPNGLRAMDIIEPGFRPKYEKICVGNKGADAQHIFFEGMLLRKGLGTDQPWYGSSAWGHPNFDRKSAHRKTLLDIMTSFVPLNNVRFSKCLESIDERSDKVILKFVNGETAEASIVVGADGISSRVREHVLETEHPDQVRPVYADSYCYRAVISIDEAEAILGELTHVAKFYFGYRRSAVTYRISEGREFNFLLCVASDTLWPLENAVTEEVSHELMMADFEDPEIDDRFRQLLSKAKPIRWGLFHHPRTSTYHRKRMVLLGDSAHASLPFQAAGAAQGIEDAVVLSSVLEATLKDQEGDTNSSSHLPLAHALAAYDSVRRPRAQKQLEQSADVARMLFFQHEDAGDDMKKILPRLQDGRFDWLWFHDIQEDVGKALLKLQK